MSPYRPDLVQVWVFRLGDGTPGAAADGLQLLLIRRAPGRILPGLWQPVTGALETGERIAQGALRELAEETGFAGERIEAFYDLDQVFHFHEPSVDGILTEAAFAVRVGTTSAAVISHEHDDARWVTPAEARRLVVWPAYLESIDRIERNLLDPELARWFQLGLDGQRMVD